jgi:uncharacterized membrane protein (UPF0127 family)
VKIRLLLLAGLVAWSASGQAGAGEPQTLPTVEACFVSQNGGTGHPLLLETAQTVAERRIGLMWREQLEEGTGMLFSYPSERSPENGFWMYNTHIPLDIAFLDDNGVIVSIRQMEPCLASNPRQCPSYPAGRFFWHAVETNAGYFKENGLKPGDRLEWPVTRYQCGD